MPAKYAGDELSNKLKELVADTLINLQNIILKDALQRPEIMRGEISSDNFLMNQGMMIMQFIEMLLGAYKYHTAKILNDFEEEIKKNMKKEESTFIDL